MPIIEGPFEGCDCPSHHEHGPEGPAGCADCVRQEKQRPLYVTPAQFEYFKKYLENPPADEPSSQSILDWFMRKP